jgi:hypothetical protein
MANINAPFGARLIGNIYGAPYNSRIRPYVVLSGDSTALYQGDFVTLVENGAVNEYGITLPAVTRAAATEVLAGVVVGVYRNADNLTLTYRPASTLQTIWVCDDPNAIFEIQSTTIALTDIGKNADIVVGTSHNVYQRSSSYLSGTMASTTAQIRILGLSNSGNNAVGAYGIVTAMINEHYFKQTAGV